MKKYSLIILIFIFSILCVGCENKKDSSITKDEQSTKVIVDNWVKVEEITPPLINSNLIDIKKTIPKDNYPISYYILINDQLPTLAIKTEKSLEQSDIDNDQDSELIATYDGEVTLYKFFNKKLYSSSINKLLNCDRVHFNSEEKYFSDDNKIYLLNLKEASLKISSKLTFGNYLHLQSVPMNRLNY